MPTKFYKILLILSLTAVVAAVLFFWFKFASGSTNLEIDFLDVGQGDAALIKSPYGQNILIDGGPDKSVLAVLRNNLPWYDKQIDLMILTHPHDDHVTGLIEVIKRYRVKRILATGVIHNAPNYLAWLGLIKEKNISFTIVDRPQTINLGEDSWLNIIYPRASLLEKTVDNLNNSSLVIKLNYKQDSFLFTGDIEAEVEEELVELEEDLTADIIKIGHHGSDTSSGERFLERVKPRLAIISVGENDFGHPSLRVLRRLERLGITIKRTDQEGTIKIFSNGLGLDNWTAR